MIRQGVDLFNAEVAVGVVDVGRRDGEVFRASRLRREQKLGTRLNVFSEHRFRSIFGVAADLRHVTLVLVSPAQVRQGDQLQVIQRHVVHVIIFMCDAKAVLDDAVEALPDEASCIKAGRLFQAFACLEADVTFERPLRFHQLVSSLSSLASNVPEVGSFIRLVDRVRSKRLRHLSYFIVGNIPLNNMLF